MRDKITSLERMMQIMIEQNNTLIQNANRNNVPVADLLSDQPSSAPSPTPGPTVFTIPDILMHESMEKFTQSFLLQMDRRFLPFESSIAMVPHQGAEVEHNQSKVPHPVWRWNRSKE